MQDLRQSSEFACFMEKINWIVGKEKNFRFYIRHLPILGNFIKIQRLPSKISAKKLESLAKKYHAFAVQINYSPTKTLQVDLTQSEEKIFAQFKKDARYEIRKAEKNKQSLLLRNKIIVKQSEDIELFIKIWHKNALRRGFWIPFGKEIRSIYQAFGKNAHLFLTYHISRITSRHPLAGALILFSDKTAYYFHAASTPEGRKLSAPYLVVWEAIKLAKRKNCEVFDFEGIYDERFPQKSWLGFSHFKKSFGGKEIEYPESFTKFYNPIIARLRRLV